MKRTGWARLGARTLEALRDRSGATAVVFSVAFAVLAPLGLGVVGVYLSSEQKGKLQDALDAATLYAARSTAQTNADIDAMGDKALAANLQLITGATLKTSDFQISGSQVVAQAKVTVPAFGFSGAKDILVNSVVQRGLDKLEVALVLDNTGSMAGTKLSTLKTQAVVLVNKLVAGSKTSVDPTPLKIALIPFSNTVRVQDTTDVSTYNASTHSGGTVPDWLDGRARSHSTGNRQDIFTPSSNNPTPDRFALLKGLGQKWAGCVEDRIAPYDIQEDEPTTSNYDTYFVPFFWPDDPDASYQDSNWPKKNTTGRNPNVNNDYLNDITTTSGWLIHEKYVDKYSTHNNNVKSGTIINPALSGYTLGPNAGCVLQPMIRLTTNFDSITTAINGMKAAGDTNIPMGLMWGWHALSPNKPLQDGSAYTTQHLRKIVILMTDGDNTYGDSSDANHSFYAGLGYIWENLLTAPFLWNGDPNHRLSGTASTSERQAYMDSRLAQLCTNMKAKGITIFTIRVEVKTGSSDLLQNCASSPSNFFNVQDVSTLGQAFDTIAADIADLHIAK